MFQTIIIKFYLSFPVLMSIFLICFNNLQQIKKITLYCFIFSFLCSLFFIYKLDFAIKPSTSIFYLNYLINTPYLNLYSIFNVNSLGLLFILLTKLIIILSIIWSWSFNWNIKNLYIFFFFLDFLLTCCFCSHDIFTFFIFFESILISMLFFIGILGLHERKIKAIYMFYVYTLLGSFFMLLGIIIIIFEIGNTGVLSISNYNLPFNKQLFLWPLLILSFLIKIPVFPFHLWLPEAHVEASTLGSVFLAAILLKLGGFGIIKFILPLLPFASIYYTPLIQIISCLGFFYCSLSALRQIDFKKIIAYSSVVHMHLVLYALFSFNLKGIIGSILLMLSHGLTSAGLFFSLGILYDRFLTRNIYLIKNIVMFMPIFTTLLFILILSNTGFPGTISFISELLCLTGIFLKIFSIKSIAIYFIFLGLVINTYYNFWFFNRLSFGNFKKELINSEIVSSITKREFYILFYLVFFIIFFGFMPGLLLINLENFTIFTILRVLY